MKLKNTNILILSLLAMTFPYVAAAETDCFHETKLLQSIILCLDQKGIDNAKAITKLIEDGKHDPEIKALADKLRQVTYLAGKLAGNYYSEITALTEKFTTLAKKQNQEIVVLNNQLVKLKIQLAGKLVKEIAKQSGQLTTLARKHNLEIKGLTDKLRQVGGTDDSEIKILADKLTILTGKHDLEIKALIYKLTTLAKKQNEEIVTMNHKIVKLKTQLADKLVKVARKHDSEIKGLNDKLRQVTYLAQKQRKEIVILKKQVLQNQNKSSKLEQQLVDLNQALEQLKGEVVYFKQPFKFDSFRVKDFKLR